MGLAAGKLDRRISIVRDVETGRDAFNKPIIAEQSITVWASKEDIRDGERWAAQQVSAEVTTRFRIRYSSQVADLDPRARIVFDGRVYAINAVKEIGRREGLEITAAARAERT